jgi:uncharacterized protein
MADYTTGSGSSLGSSPIRRIFYNPTRQPAELRAGWRLLIFLAIVVAMLYASNATIQRMRLPDRDSEFLAFELADFIIFLIASFVMGRIEHRTLADYGLPWWRMFRSEFWLGAVAGFAAITILLVGLYACRVFWFGGMALHGVNIFKWAALWAVVFLLVALREEWRSRGYILFTLSDGIGFWPAAVITSALFGLSHKGNSGEDWIGLVNAALFGVVLCLLVRRTGNLWMGIGLHMAFDWGESYFYGVADSGNVLPGHLLSPAFSGRAWLSGGTVGPEGSALCTILIVIMFLVFLRVLPRTKYPNLKRMNT